jgi:hypothetical protein
MFCKFCGALDGPGSPHDCPDRPAPRAPLQVSSGPPPTRATLQVWTVAGYALAVALLAVLAIRAVELVSVVQARSLAEQLATAFSRDGASRLVDLADRVNSLVGLTQVVGLPALIGYLIWSGAARLWVVRAGHQVTVLTRHWTYLTWRISLLVGLVLSLVMRSGRVNTVGTAEEVYRQLADGEQRLLILGAVQLVTIGIMLVVLMTLVVRVRNLVDTAAPVTPLAPGGEPPA